MRKTAKEPAIAGSFESSPCQSREKKKESLSSGFWGSGRASGGNSVPGSPFPRSDLRTFKPCPGCSPNDAIPGGIQGWCCGLSIRTHASSRQLERWVRTLEGRGVAGGELATLIGQKEGGSALHGSEAPLSLWEKRKWRGGRERRRPPDRKRKRERRIFSEWITPVSRSAREGRMCGLTELWREAETVFAVYWVLCLVREQELFGCLLSS